MYIFIDFLSEKFLGIKWNSEYHQHLAEIILLANPLVKEKDSLVQYCKIINKIPADKVTTITITEARELGLPFPCKSKE